MTKNKEIQVFNYGLIYRSNHFMVGSMGILVFSSYLTHIWYLFKVMLGLPLPTNLVYINTDFLPNIIVLGMVIFMCIMAFGIYISNPAIEVKSDKFRVRKLFWKSRWFDWDSIRHIHKSEKFGSTFYVISINELPFVAFVSGFYSPLGERAFVISQAISGFDEVINSFKEQRPDLFQV